MAANERVLIDPLVADLMEQSMRQTHAVTKSVIDLLEHRAERAETALQLVREAVQDLYSDVYLPNPRFVLSALYPSEEAVKERMEHGDRGSM